MIGPLALLSLLMALAWLIQRITNNAGWVDMFWSYSVGIAGGWVAFTSASPRHLVVLVVIAIWSLRLGTAIALRSAGAPEDPRYAKFRRDWAPQFQPRMFGFLQIQALAAWPLLFAIRAAAANPAPLGGHDSVALLIAAIAIGGETLADAQLRRFRTHQHGVCNVGLWRYSRHPNYFFEWLGWCALPCFALPALPGVLIACVAPATIYILLVYISGIPPLEAHMLASRGADFRRYQAITPAFFPWPPKEPQS